MSSTWQGRLKCRLRGWHEVKPDGTAVLYCLTCGRPVAWAPDPPVKPFIYDADDNVRFRAD